MIDPYRQFLEAKVVMAKPLGFEISEAELSPWLMPHIKRAVPWMLAGGRRALFASFGLAKTSAQLEACWRALRWLWANVSRGARGLIVMPLGVKQEFMRDAGPACLNIPVTFVQSTIECFGPGLYLTNYESFRDGKIDLSGFDVVSLDEAACLRGMGGTKTFRTAANELTNVRFKFVATATPSPNEYIEMLAYAEVLGVMDIGQAKTRFFKRNSEKADQLTLHPHKEREFWMWVASWALFINKPSDVGCSDEGYDLPPLAVQWHEIPNPPAWNEDGGESGRQLEMFRTPKISVVNQAREKRASMLARVARLAEIVAADPDDHFLLWHDLNDERDLIAEAVPAAFVLDGDLVAKDPAAAEGRILGFADGFFQYLAAKPVMAGAGCNFQRHCHRAVFVGIGFKFHDFIQAIHRIYRFGQAHGVRVDIVYSEAERGVRSELERRWAQHNDMVAKMAEIIREYGLSAAAMADRLKRSLGVERVVAVGGPAAGSPPSTASRSPSPGGGGTEAWWLANNDCVDEVGRMAGDSVDLIVTSIPFSTQYEYSPNYADFGHTDDNAHFWRQMDFLIPQLLRVLKPGRNACIHVKDRIVPGSLTGLGFQTLQPFGDECRAAFIRHGFAYLGTITNVTDVVRENNQTYRLGWSEQLKDGTRMGCGVPEQIILLRKPPSDLSNGYADEPVMKHRQAYVDAETGAYAPYDRQAEQEGRIRPLEGSGYSRSRWQQDASAFRRSAGDRLLKPEEWLTFENMDAAFQLWRDFNLDGVYDFEQHVLIGERFDALGKLPAIFQLLPTHSWHASVWTDVAQMRSLNSDALRKGQEKHLCPLPFDIVNRLIVQRSMPGELVFDPFAGIGTTPYCALKLGRRGAGVELSPDYFASAAKNCALAEQESRPVPTLFDALEAGCFEAEGVAA
jgi:DNA modification methylase